VFILSRKALREFWQRHPQAREPLEDWYTIAEGARWQNLAETRRDFPHADAVGDCTVFNISGNKYRLIVKIRYPKQKILIRAILTHAEYNKEGWKKDCGL
jgi:mRNA interferase HigB